MEGSGETWVSRERERLRPWDKLHPGVQHPPVHEVSMARPGGLFRWRPATKTLPYPPLPSPTHGDGSLEYGPRVEIDIFSPNNQRQHRTLHILKDVLPYALC